MARKAKRVICLAISLFLCSCNVLVSRAEALPEVLSGSTTLADNIMSYYALSGSAVANTDWINTLYNSYGSSFGTVEELANQGYLVLNDAGMWEPTQQLGQMIEQAPAYTSLGLNEMFNVSAEEAAAGGGFAAASGGSILAGSLGGVASTGVLPLLGGVTAAYWGGIALGTLIAHALGLYGEPIIKGSPITAKQFLSNLPSGTAVGFYSSYSTAITADSGMVFGVYDGNNNRVVFYKPNGSGTRAGIKIYDAITGDLKSSLNYTYGVNDVNDSLRGNIYSDFTPFFRRFDSTTAYNNYLNGLKTGESEPPVIYSPDMIGENGNLTGTENNNGYSVPDMKPQIDPGTQAGKPLTLPDWLAFANAVKNNNNNTAPSGSPDNATLFDNILDNIKTVIPDNIPNPNPDPNPDPNPYPDPHPNPDPDQVPVPDYQDPEQETQPDYDSETEPVPDPENGKPWVTPNLLDKFPFCIPKDLMNMAKNFNSGTRQAPEIEWRFNPPNTPIDYTFHLDLEDFEAVAVLLRTLELALFVVGLAFATRYLIGAS